MAPIHEEVLAAAWRLCSRRSGWLFTPLEVVKSLPHLNERSVRTHIVSRCCVNAPSHHQHRWPYFKRMPRRGVYEIRPPFRHDTSSVDSGPRPLSTADRVGESAQEYAAWVPDPDHRQTVHAVIVRSEAQFVAECLEVAVVTQGRSLDETVSNLREALALHLGDGDAAQLGLSPTPRLLISYEDAVGS